MKKTRLKPCLLAPIQVGSQPKRQPKFRSILVLLNH